MSLLHKIQFQFQKAYRLAWYHLRYRIYPWHSVAGVNFPVVLSMGYSVLRFINDGSYEGPLIDIVDNTLEPNDRVLELGAGMGFVSTFCAKKIGSDRVFTFEANKKLQPLINKMYAANQVQPTLQFGLLGQGKKQTAFYTHNDSFLASSMHQLEDTTVAVIDQFDLNETIRSIKPTYLVLDIEGAEYDILKHIDFHTIRKIQLETHPTIVSEKKMQEVYERLVTYGFMKDTRFAHPENFFFYKNDVGLMGTTNG
ncbi:MAG TPA: FkbM family methyltransferase [Flavipsychrobacter sp.]|nr:FkbM family methyltransferase [Flavipsychrobacter sp.]